MERKKNRTKARRGCEVMVLSSRETRCGNEASGMLEESDHTAKITGTYE
jgi:hypothetical protein